MVALGPSRVRQDRGIDTCPEFLTAKARIVIGTRHSFENNVVGIFTARSHALIRLLKRRATGDNSHSIRGKGDPEPAIPLQFPTRVRSAVTAILGSNHAIASALP